MSLVISKVFTYDTDAGNYIQAVEAADTVALEPAVRQAINNFVVGCKQDGIWSAIKASCILAGARTLSGALMPLVGTAPTNVGPFVAGDYDRKTGLVGDGSTKYLNSNRAGNAETQNNVHRGLYLSSSGGSGALTGTSRGNGGANAGWDAISGTGGAWFIASRSFLINDLTTISSPTNPGFAGTSRSGSASYSYRLSGAVGSITYTSSGFGANQANSVIVFGNLSNGTIANFSNARLAFYSIGDSLDLALLDARVTALINAFGAAIP